MIDKNDPNKAWREKMAAWEREKAITFTYKPRVKKDVPVAKPAPAPAAPRPTAPKVSVPKATAPKAAPPVQAPVISQAELFQRLKDLYDLQSKAAQNMYSNTMSQYDAQKAENQAKTTSGYSDAYQQAYLSHMQQKKEMPQLLAAMGISGGGAESTVSSMQNNYGQSRNKIDTQRLQAVTDLDAQYAKLKSQAKAQYDKQINEYETQYQRSKLGL